MMVSIPVWNSITLHKMSKHKITRGTSIKPDHAERRREGKRRGGIIKEALKLGAE